MWCRSCCSSSIYIMRTVFEVGPKRLKVELSNRNQKICLEEMVENAV